MVVTLTSKVCCIFLKSFVIAFVLYLGWSGDGFGEEPRQFIHGAEIARNFTLTF